jgi:hypothetical protein
MLSQIWDILWPPLAPRHGDAVAVPATVCSHFRRLCQARPQIWTTARFQPVLEAVGNWLRAAGTAETQELSPDLYDTWSIDSDDHVRIRTPPTSYDDYETYAPPFWHITEHNIDELIFDDQSQTSPEPEDYY